MNLVESLEKSLQANAKIPQLSPGDTVRVHQRIVEGDRERIQVFQGTVIRLRKGGANASFTVRRIASNNVGVERTYLLNSPAHRSCRSDAARQSAPRTALLLPRPSRQVGAPEGATDSWQQSGSGRCCRRCKIAGQD